MFRTAVQLYTLRGLGDSLPELLTHVGKTGFDGVEFAGLRDSNPSLLNNALDRAGLDIAGAHIDADLLAESIEGTISRYQQVGCETFVVPYLDESNFETLDAVERIAEELSELGERLSKEGISLHYHNHDHEFASLDGRTAFDILVETTTQVNFELDVGWVAAAGHDPVELLEELGSRVSLVHIKDVRTDSREPVKLGEGDVDLRACAEAARRTGAEWLIYEHDQPDDSMASLQHGFEYFQTFD